MNLVSNFPKLLAPRSLIPAFLAQLHFTPSEVAVSHVSLVALAVPELRKLLQLELHLAHVPRQPQQHRLLRHYSHVESEVPVSGGGGGVVVRVHSVLYTDNHHLVVLGDCEQTRHHVRGAPEHNLLPADVEEARHILVVASEEFLAALSGLFICPHLTAACFTGSRTASSHNTNWCASVSASSRSPRRGNIPREASAPPLHFVPEHRVESGCLRVQLVEARQGCARVHQSVCRLLERTPSHIRRRQLVARHVHIALPVPGRHLHRSQPLDFLSRVMRVESVLMRSTSLLVLVLVLDVAAA
eukprot:CAMPEP_0202825220 /NCGR_PEP_ID=MMETSP1389-20130828/12888_1 /ASSEMBLY_ACC=CAM_ASM_000865 /TAXON_ID=302021 /ORGANISM="Rhodomonas sp., Strain CCMP768" /LENGTH=299 /DNA_ID=CAMNT_0049498415 /DNA_START=129 /DNA_END=1029 /DNA_ORIENTATION=-